MEELKKRGPRPKKPGEVKKPIVIWVKAKNVEKVLPIKEKMEDLYG